jgi:aminoglycoside phosphotransferase (APT) family kinase protein
MTTTIINQRHAAYQTSEQAIYELVRRATGQEGISREKIVRGYDSEVYLVDTRQGDRFVVRIRHHGGVSFEQEAWAIGRCRAVGVPAPEVLLVETMALDGNTREVMVQRRVPGRALSEIEGDLTPEQRAAVWRQAGAALGAIHSIPVGGFYRRHADGSWDFPDWDSMWQTPTDERASERPQLMQAGFTWADVDLMLDILQVERERFPVEQPVLCHGDLSPGHLFVDDDLNLTGVIDFGEFQGGGPIVDFANLSMSCPNVDLAWLQRGYGNQELFDGAFPTRLLVAKVGQQMGYLAHYIRQGNAEEAAPIAAGLRESLREWRAIEDGAER